MVDCCHHLFHMDMFRSCGHLQVIQYGGDAPARDHSVCAVISCISCTQNLSELEVVVHVSKNKYYNPHLFKCELFPPYLSDINVNYSQSCHVMVIMDDMFRRSNRLSVFGKLNIVINFLKVFVDRQRQVDHLIHLLIVIFDIRICCLPIYIDKMLKNITPHDSEKSSVLMIQLLKVRVFGSVYNLVIVVFIHCERIIVDSPSYIILKLVLFS